MEVSEKKEAEEETTTRKHSIYLNVIKSEQEKKRDSKTYSTHTRKPIYTDIHLMA